MLKCIDTILSESPTISGEFIDINQVASYISSTPHRVLLDGYLLYAYKGNGPVKSVVITTGHKYGKFMISIFYDGYKMIQSGFDINTLDMYIKKFGEDKKLNDLYKSLIDRFYENMD